MVGQVFKIGKQPMQFIIGARYYADGQDGHADWGIRSALTFLFPK